jgi:hypothetical protein
MWSVTPAANNQSQSNTDNNILIYDPNGKAISETAVNGLYEFEWIKDNDRDYIGVLAQGSTDHPLDQSQWLLIDPITSRIFGMPGVPEIYSLSAPNGLSMFAAAVATSPEWQIDSPDKGTAKIGTLDDVYVFSHVLAISPDGQSLAYIQQGAAYVYTNGATAKIAPSDASALAWGPVAWRVHHVIFGQS